MDMEFLKSKADILVIYANAIDSRGEDGSAINGCSVHYLFLGDGLSAMVGQSEPDVTKPVGMQRGKSWVDYALRNKIRIAPAIYEGTFVMNIGSDGKPVLKLVDVAYKSNIKVESYRLEGLVVPGMVQETAPSNETTSDPVTTVPDNDGTLSSSAPKDNNKSGKR